MPADGLLILLEGSAERYAAVTLTRSVVEALIQKQTVGEVLSGGSDGRAFTGTDAALIEPLVEGFLDHSRALTEVNIDRHCVQGFRFAGPVTTPRALALALQANEYRVFSLQLDIAGGERQGGLVALLPDDPLPMAQTEDDDAGQKSSLARALPQARVVLTTSLCQLPMTLSDLRQMMPDQLIALPDAGFDRVHLVGRDGQPVTMGRLGQLDGMRAIRLGVGAGDQPHELMPEAMPGLGADLARSDVPVDLPDPSVDIPSLDPPEAELALPLDPGGDSADLSDIDADLPSAQGLDDLPDLPDLDIGGDGAGAGLPALPDVAASDPADLPLPTLDIDELPDLPPLDLSGQG